jgi:hypothetical protein
MSHLTNTNSSDIQQLSESLAALSPSDFLDVERRLGQLFQVLLGLEKQGTASRKAMFPKFYASLNSKRPGHRLLYYLISGSELSADRLAEADFHVRGAICLAALRLAELRGVASRSLPDALLAAGLEGVPADPFALGTRPLAIKGIGRGATVISVGPDSKDDQSRPAGEAGRVDGDLLLVIPPGA